MYVASATALTLALAGSAQAIDTQDAIDPNALLDTANQYNNVGGLIIINPDTPAGFVDLCTGTLINPRTVLTATHCVRNSGGSEVYTSGGPNTVRFRLDPNGAPPSIFASDVITPTGANAAFFPDLDFTIVALSKAVPDIKGAPVLLSPLTHDTVATIVGYGTYGTGSNPNAGFDFRRRVASNVIQYLGTFENFDNDTFGPGNYGDSTQMLYWVDFDRVGRQSFFDNPDGNNHNPPAGDALNDPANPKNTEGSTNQGDSGGPLLAHINGKEYLAGTLSGGLTIFADGGGNGLFSYFGTEAYWNPIYKYANFLIANNPYKYVHAPAGSGDWTDQAHWEQTLDPGYFVLDSLGNPVNGIPTSTPSDAAAQFGTFRNIFDVFNGGTGLPASAKKSADPALIPTSALGAAEATPSSIFSGNPSASARPSSLQGPGSRNFVPNNTNGTPGTEFANPAQYFDVTLDMIGITTLKNAAIEIDHLTIYNLLGALDVRSTANLKVNLETEVALGTVNVDGTLSARSFFNTLGIVSGKGHIATTNGFTNLVGIVAPAGLSIGTLTVDGNYTQSKFGTIVIDIGSSTNDLLQVNGVATMAGNLVVGANRKLRFGEHFTVVQANSVVGNFDHTFSSGTLLTGATVAHPTPIELVINAQKMSTYIPAGNPLGSLAAALDIGRGSSFANLVGVYDLVDNVSVGSLASLLPTLTPTGAYNQMPLAIDYAQTFTRDLFDRSAELRSGQSGMSERSYSDAVGFLQGTPNTRETGHMVNLAGAAQPGGQPQRLGMFISTQGHLSDVSRETYRGMPADPVNLRQSGMASLTFGADYRMNDHVAFGIATTLSRNLVYSGNKMPLDHTAFGSTAYASAWRGAAFADSFVGYAQHTFAFNRTIVAGGTGQTAESAPRAAQILAGGRVGYTFEPMRGLRFSPTASLSYMHVDMSSYRESGGNAFDLIVDKRATTSMTISTGAEFSFKPTRRSGAASPFAAFGRFGFVKEVGTGGDRIQARFAAAPDVAFSLNQPLEKQWYMVGGGASYAFGANTSLSFSAQSDIGRNDPAAAMLAAGFSHRF